MKYTNKLITLLSIMFIPVWTRGGTDSCIGHKIHVKHDIFTIENNFTAATISNSLQYGADPTNLNGWVGPEQYILMCYPNIRSFNKVTGEPDGVLNIDADSFFEFSTNDVRIDYDRFAQRWYMSCENDNSGSTDIVLAVSEDAIITKCTKWHFYTIPLDQLGPLAVSTDYQQLAVDQNAVYIVVDVFDASGNSWASVIVFQKSSLLELNPIVTIFDEVLPSQPLYPPNNAGNPNNFIPPADNFDRNPKFGYLIHANCAPNNVLVPVAYNQLQFWRIANPASNKPVLIGSGENPAQANPININIPMYVTCGNAPHKGNLFGSDGFLQTSDGSFLFAPHVRNKQLYACHPILVNAQGKGDLNGDRIGVRWYQFDLTGDPTGEGQGVERPTTVPLLIQYGTLYDNQDTLTPKNYYISSIMTNKLVDMVVEATVSGEDDYTDVVYAARSKNDPLGTLRDPIYLTNNNSELMNPYNFGSLADPTNGNLGQRWGDLSSLCPDPCNDLDIWSTGEWAALYNGWGIQATQLSPLNAPKQCVSPLAQALINKQCGC